MSMERTGPRIYVPLSLPDHASQPTYAVLEFVGFSSPAPASTTPHLLHPPPSMPSPSPAIVCLSPPSSSNSPSSFFPLSVTPPVHHPLISNPHNSLISTPSHFPISHFPDQNTLYLPSPPHLLTHHPRPLPASRLDIVNLESPPLSPSSLAPSSASSVSRDSSKEKHPHSSTPLPLVANPTGATAVVSSGGLTKPMVSFSSSPDAASLLACASSRPIVSFNSSADGTSSGLNKTMVNFSSGDCTGSGLSKPMASYNSSGDGEIMQTQISVSQTDRETIVHTHSSNFRDVVRQLTGASSDDQDLRPVTLPARLANRVNNASIVQNANMGTEMIASGAVAGAGAGGSACASVGGSKEQLGLRKAPMKLHERRKSSMKNLEKVTTAFNHHATELSPLNPSPVTPLASDFERFCNASTPTSQGNSGLSSPINLISKGKGSMEGSNERRGLEPQQESGSFYTQRPLASARPPGAPVEKASPTLLSLFPESPACSPRDR